MVYNDASRKPDPSAFTKLELWHSDVNRLFPFCIHDFKSFQQKKVSYEIQPPSTTSLKLLTGPDIGGDTLWSSG